MIITHKGKESPSKTCVAQKYEDIDFKSLKKGDSVAITSDPPEVITYITSLNDAIHLFSCISIYCEDFGNIIVRRDEFNMSLIEMPNGKVLSTKSTVYSYGIETIRRDAVDYTEMIPKQHFFDVFFEEDNFVKLMVDLIEKPGQIVYESKDKLNKYVSVPLKYDGHFLVLEVENEIDLQDTTWECNTNTYIINRKMGVYKLGQKFDKIREYLVQNNLINEFQTNYIDSLLKTLQNISKRPHQMKSAQKKIESIGVKFDGLDGFFRPIYINKALNLEVFVDNFIYDPSLIYLVDEQKVKPGDIPVAEIRKAEAVFDFVRNGDSGVNPSNGKVYHRGHLLENESNYYYTTHGCLYRGAYYVKIDDHYVISKKDHKDIDTDILKRVDDVISLAKKLTK